MTYCFVFNIFDIVPNTFKIFSPGTLAQQDPIQNEVVDDIENEDPVQRVMDGGSDDEMDEELESDDDDTVLNIVAPTWCITTSGMRPLQLTRTNELLVPVPGDGKPIYWFNLLLGNVYLEEVCKLSNEYALEVLLKPDLTPKSRICKWKDLTVPELRVFIGLILHMGTIRLNRLQDYWKTDWLLNFACFRKCMARDRFLLIERCLHFNSNRNVPQTNQSISKVAGLVDYFNNKMQLL